MFLRKQAQGGVVKLVYGGKDTEHNHAVVLDERLTRSAPAPQDRDPKG